MNVIHLFLSLVRFEKGIVVDEWIYRYFSSKRKYDRYPYSKLLFRIIQNTEVYTKLYRTFPGMKISTHDNKFNRVARQVTLGIREALEL